MNQNQNRTIIFCQSSADVQYVLSLYEQFKNSSRVSIFVLVLIDIYNHFQSLNLDIDDLVFIPFPENVPLKNFKELRKIKSRLNANYDLNFKNLQGQSVYFFSKYFDWQTAFFVSKISKKNKVVFINHSGETLTGTKPICGPIVLYRKLLYKYLTSVNFRFLKMQSTTMIEFPVENYPIKKSSYVLDPTIILKYRVKTETNLSKSVLLFENNQSVYDFYSDYELNLTSIFELFKKCGFNIYLKPHPWQGCSEFSKPFIDKLLPSQIPAEFFNPDDFTFIAGVETGAIAFFAKNYPAKTLSLLDLFGFKREEEKERFRQAQLTISDGNINFVPSIKELEQLIS